MNKVLLRKSASMALCFLVATGMAHADELIESCQQCHSPGVSAAPVISGISAYVLESSLKAYVDGSRPDLGFKKKMVEQLSPEQLSKISEFFAAQPFTPIKQATNPAIVAKGKLLHEAHCERCHTENGSVADDDSSILAGQLKSYLVKEMMNYKNGSRVGDNKMVSTIKALESEQLNALAEFYAAQQ